jgi:hypothetical protein
MLLDHGIVFALIHFIIRNVESTMTGRKNIISWKLMAVLIVALVLLTQCLTDFRNTHSWLNADFSGAITQQILHPWATATYNAYISPEFIDLAVRAADLIKSGYVKVWRFTLDPTLEPKGILICRTLNPSESLPPV